MSQSGWNPHEASDLRKQWGQYMFSTKVAMFVGQILGKKLTLHEMCPLTHIKLSTVVLTISSIWDLTISDLFVFMRHSIACGQAHTNKPILCPARRGKCIDSGIPCIGGVQWSVC